MPAAGEAAALGLRLRPWPRGQPAGLKASVTVTVSGFESTVTSKGVLRLPVGKAESWTVPKSGPERNEKRIVVYFVPVILIVFTELSGPLGWSIFLTSRSWFVASRQCPSENDIWAYPLRA